MPPISESREWGEEEEDRDDASHTSRSTERSLERGRPVRKVARSADFTPSKPRAKPETPWNKYKENRTSSLPRGKASTSKDRQKEEEKDEEEAEEEEVDEEGRKVPGYMKSTTSSKKRHYLEEEGRGRRAGAWK